jgi:hypothetical protein
MSYSEWPGMRLRWTGAGVVGSMPAVFSAIKNSCGRLLRGVRLKAMGSEIKNRHYWFSIESLITQ